MTLATALEVGDRRPGWLSHLDAELILLLLSAQRGLCAARGILEIGVFAGKSALFLALGADLKESLYLCDPFIDTDHTPLEGPLPTLDATVQWLEEHRAGLEVVAIPERSEALVEVIGREPSTLRAVHVDGDHGFDAVSADLHYASLRVCKSGGLIIVDDYRTAHTPGVAAAFWPWLATQEAPCTLVLSEHKAYLLIGAEWNAVVGSLPADLQCGHRAASEVIGHISAIRYSRMNGA